MPYVATNWVDYPNLSTAINAARLNNIEAGIVAAYVFGAGGLANVDIASNAAISYSKINLALSIVDADISAAAAISPSKIKDYPSDATKVLSGAGTWIAASAPQLDYAQITASPSAITATTEGTSATIITGNSVTFDGTAVMIECYFPGIVADSTGRGLTFVFYVDSTVIGQAHSAPVTAAITGNNAPNHRLRYTPSAGAHVFKVAGFVNAGNITPQAGAGGSGALLPAYLRVVKA